MTSSEVTTLTTAAEPPPPQLELFVKVACPRGRRTLLGVEHVLFALEPGQDAAVYAYRCPRCATIHWDEAAPELAHLLIALGASTPADAASPPVLPRGERALGTRLT